MNGPGINLNLRPKALTVSRWFGKATVTSSDTGAGSDLVFTCNGHKKELQVEVVANSSDVKVSYSQDHWFKSHRMQFYV